jgi:adenylate kinase
MKNIKPIVKKSFVQKIKEKAKNARERLKSIIIRKSLTEERQNISLVKPKLGGKKQISKKAVKKSFKLKKMIQKKVSSKKIMQKKSVRKKIMQKSVQKKSFLKKQIIKNKIPAIPQLSILKQDAIIVKSAPKKIRRNRMVVIAISGTPGTGKTTVARQIEKEFGILHLDVNSIIKEYSLSEGYDPVRRCEIIDTNKLKKALIMLILKAKRPIIIDSHMSHYLPKEYVDLCIITKCSPKTLNQRLSKRGYHDAKIRENLDSEIFEVCMNEAVMAGHDIYVIETEQSTDLTGLNDRLKILKDN